MTGRCDALSLGCPGMHVHHTQALKKFAVLPEMDG